MNLAIRQAGVQDAHLIATLGTVTFYEAYFEQDEPSDIADYCIEWFAPQKILLEIENPISTFFIAYHNGKAIGYAKLRDGDKPEGVAENSVELQRIYTIERVWGKGAGELLLQHCCQAAKEKGFQNIWLGVWEENIRAQRFYAKYNFNQVGAITFPYGETVGNNLVLEKIL